MKKKQIEAEIVTQIIKDYETLNIGMKAIGEKYGLTKDVIKRLLIDNNVTLKPPGQRFKGGKSESDKRYYQKNKEALSSYYKEWYASTDKNKLKESKKKWTETNKEKLKEYKRIKQKEKINSDFKYKFSLIPIL